MTYRPARDLLTGLEVHILQPGAWYRDHVLFFLNDESGPSFSCTPVTLAIAARAAWCKTSDTSPIYNYAADLTVALVEVRVNTDAEANPIDGTALKAAIASDLTALSF